MSEGGVCAWGEGRGREREGQEREKGDLIAVGMSEGERVCVWGGVGREEEGGRKDRERERGPDRRTRMRSKFAGTSCRFWTN